MPRMTKQAKKERADELIHQYWLNGVEHGPIYYEEYGEMMRTMQFGDVAGESDHWPGGVCLTHYGKDSVAAFAVNGGKYKVATAVGGLKFSMASGNIENFNIQIYGMKGTTS